MSSNESTQALALKQGARPYQLAIGFVLSVAMLMLGTTSVAGATNGTQSNGSVPQSKEDCRKGGWREFGFKNQGQCVAAVNAETRPGNGYGGNNGNNIGIDLSVNGDNNVVNVIINFLFG